MFDDNALLTLGIMANTYKSVLSSAEELLIIEDVKAIIRAELKARAIETNRVNKELDLIAHDYCGYCDAGIAEQHNHESDYDKHAMDDVVD